MTNGQLILYRISFIQITGDISGHPVTNALGFPKLQQAVYDGLGDFLQKAVVDHLVIKEVQPPSDEVRRVDLVKLAKEMADQFVVSAVEAAESELPEPEEQEEQDEEDEDAAEHARAEAASAQEEADEAERERQAARPTLVED